MGKAIGVTAAILALAAAVIAARDLFGESALARDSRDRVFVCVETGKPFEYTIKKGDMYPVSSPHSGKNTGYPAELCFWTADGKAKDDPTPVLLNVYTGKKGPTFCPDCKRLVVPVNPAPMADEPPPPTQADYKPRRRGGDEEGDQQLDDL